MEELHDYNISLDMIMSNEMDQTLKMLIGNIMKTQLDVYYLFISAIYLMLVSETYSLKLTKEDFKQLSEYSLKISLDAEKNLIISLEFPKQNKKEYNND